MKEAIRKAMPYLVPVLLLAITAIGARNMDAGQDGQARERLETSLRRAIAAEYAVSGAYPESLDGLLDTYGIRVDEERFYVVYTPDAENIPPSLDIIDLQGG